MVINKRAWAAIVALVAVLLLAAPAAAGELRGPAELSARGLWERAWTSLLDSWAAVVPDGGLRIEWAASDHGGTIDPDGQPKQTAPRTNDSGSEPRAQSDHGGTIDPDG